MGLGPERRSTIAVLPDARTPPAVRGGGRDRYFTEPPVHSWECKVEISVEPKDSQDIVLGRNLGRIPIWRLKTTVEISVEPKDSQDIVLGISVEISIWRLKTAVEISVEPKESQDIPLGRNLGRIPIVEISVWRLKTAV